MEKIFKFTVSEIQDILWLHLKQKGENVCDDDVLDIFYGDYPSNFEQVSETDHICLKVS